MVVHSCFSVMFYVHWLSCLGWVWISKCKFEIKNYFISVGLVLHFIILFQLLETKRLLELLSMKIDHMEEYS